MDFVHDGHPGRRVRLAYCLNVHPADDLEGVLDGLATITRPLRERLAPGRPFGVGMYLPAAVAAPLAAGGAPLERLRAALDGDGLVPFTFNAFPYGGFHERGLKRSVFRPRWDEPERVAFTDAVAAVAVGQAGVRAAFARGDAVRQAAARRRAACVRVVVALAVRVDAGGAAGAPSAPGDAAGVRRT